MLLPHLLSRRGWCCLKPRASYRVSWGWSCSEVCPTNTLIPQALPPLQALTHVWLRVFTLASFQAFHHLARLLLQGPQGGLIRCLPFPKPHPPCGTQRCAGPSKPFSALPAHSADLLRMEGPGWALRQPRQFSDAGRPPLTWTKCGRRDMHLNSALCHILLNDSKLKTAIQPTRPKRLSEEMAEMSHNNEIWGKQKENW